MIYIMTTLMTGTRCASTTGSSTTRTAVPRTPTGWPAPCTCTDRLRSKWIWRWVSSTPAPPITPSSIPCPRVTTARPASSGSSMMARPPAGALLLPERTKLGCTATSTTGTPWGRRRLHNHPWTPATPRTPTPTPTTRTLITQELLSLKVPQSLLLVLKERSRAGGSMWVGTKTLGTWQIGEDKQTLLLSFPFV